ncbi:MAG TPA: caspase family protein [Steroidobacteraceae bacterium]|nr:caspase family protein [Steroidobacteraceae bacterium]
MSRPVAGRRSLSAALGLIAAGACLAQSVKPDAQSVKPDSAVGVSPLAQVRNGREARDNNRILTTGIRAPRLPSNHALIITVSEYPRSPLPGVVTDRKLGIELAQRFGVPANNIVELSEQQVTREGLSEALKSMDQLLMPGDKLFVYFSGHGARFYSPESKQCEESIVMQDMHVVTKNEFAGMLKPLTAKSDKTVVMLDSCHSGGVAQIAGTRALSGDLRAKFSAEASSPQCSVAVNVGSFSQSRGIDLATTDNNLVILAASRKNEVAWSTSHGSALTYNFEQCLSGDATDTDQSGSISMQELTDCVQRRLDKTQAEDIRQHATLTGNAAVVPAFVAAEASTASGEAPGRIDTLAALKDIYAQRDDRWEVEVKLGQPTVKIGENLSLTVRSNREGFLYLFYRGSQPDSFYLLFPNQLDSSNALGADYELHLPREGWTVTALGPRGTDHILAMVTETPRDFSSLSLPAEYVSSAGPFDKIRPTAQAVARVGQIATLSAALKQPECTGGARDLGIARRCSNVFGAGMVSVEETD